MNVIYINLITEIKYIINLLINTVLSKIYIYLYEKTNFINQ